jgi:hypothetical protein
MSAMPDLRENEPLLREACEAGVLRLTLNRPAARNALSTSMMAALGAVILSGLGFILMIQERAEEEREKLIHELQDALANVKTLRGLLPICSYCKKIRDDKGYWNRLESYIRDHSGAEFTHGICPECLKKLYSD